MIKWIKVDIAGSHNSYSNIRTTRAPSGNKKNETNDPNLDLAIRRQAGTNATLIVHMLNPDHVVEPENSRPGAPKIAINELRGWGSFANHNSGWDTTIKGKVYPTVSVESFHDGIHGLIGTGDGGRGHMGNPTVAAVSVLHSSNINLSLTQMHAV